MKSTYIITALLTLVPFISFAHEGHNEGLAQVQALHGGIPKEGKLFHVEIVPEKEQTKIYILPHKGDQIQISEVTMKAKIEFPKSSKKKAIEVNLTPAGDHFSYIADTAGVNRYTLKLNANFNKKSQDFKINIESKQ